MKKLQYIFIVFTAVALLGSCKNFLDVQPKGAISDESTIVDKTSAETAVRGMYRSLGNASYYGETYVTLGFFPGGDVISNTTGGGQNLININFRSDEPLLAGAWAAIYTTINRANQVIAKLPAVQDAALTTAYKNQLLGEAYFVRALAYFDLARAWGGVQLKLQPTTSANSTAVPRSTQAETYAQVLKDLQTAEPLLPDAINRVRATKKTVWALKARLFLYEQDWVNAETYATQVINDVADYQLQGPFSSWFANNVVASPESIFELEFSAANPNTIRAEMQHPTRGGTYRFAPNTNVINLLKTPVIGGGRRALIDSVKQGSTVLWFGNLYYRSPATDPAYILRLAEIYLIRAEARAQQNNNTPGALSDINAVRNRAGLGNISAATTTDLLLAIENERRYEFLWEAQRWFDLARTGRANAVLHALNPSVSVQPYQLLFPIPANEVTLDPQLTQNPGY
jgi:hypothetical protein